MELVNVGIGLIFWMTLAFLLLVFILRKFAWKPIMGALKEREDSIENALHMADKAREEMAQLQANNEQLLREAREERDAMLKETRQLRDNIIEEAKQKANAEYNRILDSARENIQFEKMAAITELKNEVASLSLQFAEKLLREELSDKAKHEEYIRKHINEIKFN